MNTNDSYIVQINPSRWIIGCTFVVTYSVAILLRAPLLFLMSSTCLALVLLAYTVSRIGLSAAHAQCAMPSRVTEGEEVPWSLSLRNAGRFPIVSLSVRFIGDDNVVFVRGLSEEDACACFLSMLMPGERIELTGTLRFDSRGRHQVPGIALQSQDPLNLTCVRTERPGVTSVLVLPRRFPMENGLPLMSSAISSDTVRASTTVAEGGEFRGTRNYVPGDPLRRVHWKWTAKWNEFRVVEFEEELSGSATIILDLHSGSHVGKDRASTLEYAIRIVASLAEHLVRRGQEVVVFCQQQEEVAQFRLNGIPPLDRFLDFLAVAQADGSFDLAALLDRIRGNGSARCALLISPAPHSEVSEATLTLGRDSCAVVWIDSRSFGDEAPVTREPLRTYASQSRWISIRKGDNLRRALRA